MLVLTRKLGQRIIIHTDPQVSVTIVEVSRSAVRVGIEAPADVVVLRKEVSNKEGPTN